MLTYLPAEDEAAPLQTLVGTATALDTLGRQERITPSKEMGLHVDIETDPTPMSCAQSSLTRCVVAKV